MNLPGRKGSRGQAMVEYAVVAMLGAMALIWSTWGEPSPIQQLIGALRSFYKAFSFAISVAS